MLYMRRLYKCVDTICQQHLHSPIFHLQWNRNLNSFTDIYNSTIQLERHPDPNSYLTLDLIIQLTWFVTLPWRMFQGGFGHICC